MKILLLVAILLMTLPMTGHCRADHRDEDKIGFVSPGITGSNGPGAELSTGFICCRGLPLEAGGIVFQYEKEKSLFNAGVEAGLAPFIWKPVFRNQTWGNPSFVTPDLALPIPLLLFDHSLLITNIFYRYYPGYKDRNGVGASLKLLIAPDY